MPCLSIAAVLPLDVSVLLHTVLPRVCLSFSSLSHLCSLYVSVLQHYSRLHVMLLDVTVLLQTVLHLDVFVLQQFVLPLDVSFLQQPVLSIDLNAMFLA